MDEYQVFTQYGRTMRFAQLLERRLKILLGLHKVMTTISKCAIPLGDLEFNELLLAGDGNTLGQAIRGLLQELPKIGLTSLPEDVETALRQTVETRNFVAHHYFETRGVLIRNEVARPYLLAELEWFSTLFEAWIPKLDKWTDNLLSALGITSQERNDAEAMLEAILPDLCRDHLTELKSHLVKIGIDVPAIPEMPACVTNSCE
jgi:hypothetical protein